ncbi:hypothetical protein STEG23_015190, partial [Scotinomys teguina]
MADHAFVGTSGNTSLRSLCERLAAVAQELAEERQHKHGTNFSAVTKRCSCTPVLDGSVLKNDLKQQLAKERREERKRQQEAKKEKQLLEKEQRAKVQYEKQLEERHRKLREQKEKDERRRVSAEEKRKQKQAEDKEKFKAVVSRTMERCNRADQRQKRRSWEGGATNTYKSGMTTYVSRYVTVPMFTSDEPKSSTVFSKSSVKMAVPAKLEITPTKTVETPLKEHVERPAKVNAETPSKMNMKIPSQTNLDGPSKANVEIAFQNMEDISKVKVDITRKVNIEVPTGVNSTRHPVSNVEEFPTVSVNASSSAEPSPVVSEDSSHVLSTGSSSFMSVEISPIVSLDTSPELSTDSVSAVASEGNLETSLKTSRELNLEASVEAQPERNLQASSKNPEVGKRSVNLTTKNQVPPHIPCYRWLSSTTLEWCPPSPMKAVRQNQKIQPPSPLSVSSKLSPKTSLLYKVTPVQNIMYMPNALSIITKKKEIVQRRMINPEFGSRSVPSSESAMKVSVETHHEQKGSEESERVQKETKQSVAKKLQGMAERVDEVPAEEFFPCKDEQQEKDLTMRHFEPPEEQKEQLQKENNTMLKSQDSAEMRKKEQEKIMLQNLQERLERKKASEISDNCPSEENEADDEGETESDEDSLDVFPSGMKTSLNKLKKFHENAKRRPQKLVFLRAGSCEVDTEKKIHFNGNTTTAKQNDLKDFTAQAKGIKTPTKKPPTRTVRTRKTREANPTIRSSVSVTTNQKEWVCDKIIDLTHNTQSPVTKTTAGNSKHNLKYSMTTHQDTLAPLDNQKRVKPVSVPLRKVLSHLHLPGRATNLENPFASGCSRMVFGGEEEDS